MEQAGEVSGRSGWRSPPKSRKEGFEKQTEMSVVNALGYNPYCLGANIKVSYIFNLQTFSTYFYKSSFCAIVHIFNFM